MIFTLTIELCEGIQTGAEIAQALAILGAKLTATHHDLPMQEWDRTEQIGIVRDSTNYAVGTYEVAE